MSLVKLLLFDSILVLRSPSFARPTRLTRDSIQCMLAILVLASVMTTSAQRFDSLEPGSALAKVIWYTLPLEAKQSFVPTGDRRTSSDAVAKMLADSTPGPRSASQQLIEAALDATADHIYAAKLVIDLANTGAGALDAVGGPLT